MMKYFLSEGNINNESTGAIAKIHIEEWLCSRGYKKLQYNYLLQKNFFTQLYRLLKTLIWFIRIPRKSIVIFHFPIVPLAYRILLKLLHLKGVFVVAIIHDLNGLRFRNSKELGHERKLLRFFSHLIVHNKMMCDFLRTDFPTDKMSLLWLFDYKTSGQEYNPRKLKKEITVAANLEKTQYLNQLLTWNNFNAEFVIFIYGTIPKNLNLQDVSNSIVFRGAINPEDLPLEIEGSFGMVWDGISLDTCTGSLGEYLRYNSPHKLSMYLAAGMPVIVWEQSAMAEWVLENKVGMAVISWTDAISKIEQLNASTYKEYCDHAKNISTRLRKGEFLKHVLGEIEAKART